MKIAVAPFTATITLSAALLVGCASKPKPAPMATPVSAEALASMRESFTRYDADAKLASVKEVLPTGSFLRLADASPADFPMGSVVAVIDNMRMTVAHGTVAKSDAEGVDVRYESASTRGPMAGDVAVKFSDALAGSAASPAATTTTMPMSR